MDHFRSLGTTPWFSTASCVMIPLFGKKNGDGQECDLLMNKFDLRQEAREQAGLRRAISGTSLMGISSHKTETCPTVERPRCSVCPSDSSSRPVKPSVTELRLAGHSWNAGTLSVTFSPNSSTTPTPRLPSGGPVETSLNRVKLFGKSAGSLIGSEP